MWKQSVSAFVVEFTGSNVRIFGMTSSSPEVEKQRAAGEVCVCVWAKQTDKRQLNGTINTFYIWVLLEMKTNIY